MMGRRIFIAAGAALIGTVMAVPAVAQFGSIFGDPPPRPPSSVPGGGRNSAPSYPSDYPPPRDYPQQRDYPQERGYPSDRDYPPEASYPPPGGYRQPDGYPPRGGYQQPPRGQGGVRSRPLPPPSDGGSGTAAVEPNPRQPVRPTRAPPQQPSDTSPQAGDEVITEPPAQRIANSAALFSGLDKITGRIINFDVAIGETVQFGALQLTPRACYTRPATETANTDSFIEVDEVTLQGEVRRIFTGWVFASSPGLHAVEHPIYDLWLTDCKGPLVTAEKPAADPAPAAAPAARPPARQPSRQRQPSQVYQPTR
jgi:hypothetical protein